MRSNIKNIEYINYGDFILIHSLYVPKAERNSGEAKKLLSETIFEIQKKFPDIPIEIDAKPSDDSICILRLVNLYGSFGFRKISAENGVVHMKLG